MNYKIALIIVCCFLLPLNSQGQKRAKKVTVTGMVTDEIGKPLMGISIFIDKENTSVVTNENGQYKIKFKPGIEIISAFSLVNGIQEIKYEGQSEINFTLGNHSFQTGTEENEVGEVVDIGYQKVEKDKLTNVVESVDLERKSISGYNNIYEMIQGEVPGVFVKGTSIQIRGVSSINLSTEPLLIVDGSPVSSLGHIHPSEVASINVLKGASASIYGSRGSNGVILVRLK